MDCPANHRYHPHAPPSRFLGKEWKGQNYDARLPGGRQGRQQRGRRGAGNMAKPRSREDLYQSYSSRALPKGQPHKNSSPSWHPGRSMNYGPPRPPATFYCQRNTRVHYRGGGYSSPPKVHPKSLRPACASSKGLINTSFSNGKSLLSTSESLQVNKHVTVSVKSSSNLPQQTNNNSQAQRDGHTTSTTTIVNLQPEKKSVSTDNKNPSVVKVAPYIHQPSPNSTKSIDGTNSSLLTLNTPTFEKASQVKPEDQVNLPCGTDVPTNNVMVPQGSQITASALPCLASQDGMMTVFAPTSDGQMAPIIKTICSCQLRKRALKYADKGKTKNDSIIIDSDEEGDSESKAAVGSVYEQGAKMSTDCTSVNGLFLHNQPAPFVSTQASSPSCPVTESIAETTSSVVDCVQQMNKGGAKMSTETASGDSLSLHNQSAPDVSALTSGTSCQVTESMAETASRVVDSLGLSLGDVCGSSTSSDSLSAVTANFTVAGCDPNLQLMKAKGKTALHAAAAGGYVDIIACLRLAGCDLNLVDYENRTPIFDAVSNHKVKAIEYLVDCGAVLGTKDTKGMTCLHLAARQGHTDLIKLLLKTGKFDINEKQSVRRGKNEVLRKRLNDIKSSLTLKTQLAAEIASEKGASNWLTIIPIEEMGFTLNKGEFRDAIKLRYDWEIADKPSSCICCDVFNVDHVMVCRCGGFIIQRHNELRDHAYHGLQ
ncbi:Histone-lysine N-methyltransferase EHMT1 [Stylophora pistillata]|uniref:Histone-lysine N-methyltransferase EHMT1 n=1 Tax=Stylophora pistillata TaxID=50429 RepID=A0A2B4RKG2_STYPI|nr:Histone-lysine N-methyltransferase EHMT1 [Stylophora pistillata]